jgi:hypothetical protein
VRGGGAGVVGADHGEAFARSLRALDHAKTQKRKRVDLGFRFDFVARGRFDGWTTLISEEFVVRLTSDARG